jgi:DNA-binding NarL/FixJ family response regulator
MAENIRLFIAECNDITRALLVELLNELETFQVVGSSLDGADTLERCEQLRPDAVLLSSHLGTYDGVTTTRLLREKNSPSNIILMSSGLEGWEWASALTAGADAILMLEEVTIPAIEQCVKDLCAKKCGSGNCSLTHQHSRSPHDSSRVVASAVMRPD